MTAPLKSQMKPTTWVRAAAGALLLAAGAAMASAATAQPIRFKFSFSSATVVGYTHVSPAVRYSDDTGYGFEPGPDITAQAEAGGNPLTAGHVTSDQPFFFSVRIPEGNYRVTVTLGDAQAESTTTVKAELRRLMVEQARAAAGQFITRTFPVNVRTPQIPGGGTVGLLGREKQKTPGGEWFAWDDKLTLEFSGAHACVCSVEIEPAGSGLTTVYLIGDSTVCDQPAEPFNSWGQMLTRWLKPGVVVANHAESGERAAEFYAERRMDKIMSTLEAGDYVFVQFGHNDMKPASKEPVETYAKLFGQFVADARRKGAIPVLITPVSRETFDDSGKIANSFGDYPEAVRRVAKEQNVALIDLQKMSAAFYEALGKGRAQVAFANEREQTHHSDYGSYEIAQCIVQGIIDNKLPLARSIVDGWKTFDPSHPALFADFKLPADPKIVRVQTPKGN